MADAGAGVVVLVDQVDQNLVRGVVPQLKADFGIDADAANIFEAVVRAMQQDQERADT